mgnify:CR=1 FL=1
MPIKCRPCYKCVHYHPVAFSSSFISPLSTCSKFLKNINRESVESCRQNEKKCGRWGTWFKRETNVSLRLKMYKHMVKSQLNSMVIPASVFLSALAVKSMVTLIMKLA